MLDELLSRFAAHDRRALAHLLSLLADGQQLEDILRRLCPGSPRSRVVALTGSGGVGKSTLIGKLIELLRSLNITVAVLACDPQSPVSGGALLGDRARMSAPCDDGLFIRSLAAMGGRSAIAEHLDAMIETLEAYSFDVVVVETVGAGQGDTRVRELADVLVLMLQPESGDELQWEKAGLLEVADVVFIHKADLPGADHVQAQVRASLSLAPGKVPQVLAGSARTGAGLRELWDAIAALPLRPRRLAALDRRLLEAAQERVAGCFDGKVKSPELEALFAEWKAGKLGLQEAVAALLRLAGQSGGEERS
jgi:LAO/AO transport system ATPase